MLNEIVSIILDVCALLSFLALIDGVIEYRRSPYLAWLKEEAQRLNDELENTEEE